MGCKTYALGGDDFPGPWVWPLGLLLPVRDECC